jgi:hypothetical protein
MNGQMVLIILISLLAALASGGAVWFGTDLYVTMKAALAERRAEKARIAAEKAAEEEAAKGEGEKIF